jgi:hypothetical protein
MVKSALMAAFVTGMVLSAPAWAVTGANSNDTGGNAGATGVAKPDSDTKNAGTAGGATGSESDKMDPDKKSHLGTMDTMKAKKGTEEPNKP